MMVTADRKFEERSEYFMEELTVEEVCSWFEANMEKSIIIKKEEQKDIDRIEIELQDVGLMSFSDTVDEYLSKQAILLRGNGSIETHDGNKQNLPEDSYEIPYRESFHGVRNEKGIEIQTESANYFITIQ